MTCFPHVDDDRLIDLTNDPATPRQRWAHGRLCADLPDGTYFPEDGESPPANALARCAVCPVATECLATALVHEHTDGYRFGWWGGLSPDERDLLWGELEAQSSPAPTRLDFGDPVTAARHLREQGLTVPAIADALMCTKRSVYRYLAAAAA